ncbi:MAG: 50S ribosomal protein L1 [Patescibacteria group bacterium]|nr:50S ribosomal protein L1 [Patescibacteria group bacterium]
MGKIRVMTLGDEAAEKEQQKELQKKKAEKRIEAGKKAEKTEIPVVEKKEEIKKETKSSTKSSVKKSAVKETRSNRYKTIAKIVDRNKAYSLTEALEILPKLQTAKFDETVELHINLKDKGVSGNVTLPHGTGKEVRVAIADDKLIAEIEKGKIAFDVLLAKPEAMPKLAKVARFLGPRGLMPNPKSGTITNNPEEAAKKFQGGQINFKSESKAPIIHMIVGKVSFGDKKLVENIKAAIKAVNAEKIKNVTLKSTMSPGIKISL